MNSHNGNLLVWSVLGIVLKMIYFSLQNNILKE